MNILLVDDSAAIRRQLSRLLAGIEGVRVVGEASSEAQALALVESTRPDLVLLDVLLEPGNGVNVLRGIRAGGHACRVLMVTNQLRAYYGEITHLLGADGFYDKSSDIPALLHHIRTGLPARPASHQLPIDSPQDPA